MSAAECRAIFTETFRTERQVFFVFDNEFCQNEADDPKDAIVYFYPHETSDNVRCTLCCQLMGMCRFMSSCFAPVSLIRLEKGKFSIKTMGKYTLALKGNVDMPDKVLERQLATLIRLFTFYYKDFNTVFNKVGDNRPEFINHMTSLWSHLLAMTQHGGDTVSLIFDIIPHLEIPKSAGLFFLQTSQMLQACQRFSGVYAGCLFCDRRVLFSQLSIGILSKLSFIWQKQRAPGEYFKVPYELPGGITLIRVYLTLYELHELELMRLSGVLSTNIKAEEATNTSDSVSTVSADSRPVISADPSEPTAPSSGTSYTPLTQTSASATISFTEDSCGYSSSGTRFTTSTEQSSNLGDIQNESQQLQQKLLYIQQYNDTTLVLILDENSTNDKQLIYGLWKLCSETIMFLESDVKNCVESSTKKEPDSSDLSYLYLQYDKIWRRSQGNTTFSRDLDSNHHLFSRSAQLLHEDFIAEPQLYETTVRSCHEVVVYGHMLGSRETYFSSVNRLPKPSASSSSSGSGKSSQGFPLHSDLTATVATKARRRLAKEQRLVLL